MSQPVAPAVRNTNLIKQVENPCGEHCFALLGSPSLGVRYHPFPKRIMLLLGIISGQDNAVV